MRRGAIVSGILACVAAAMGHAAAPAPTTLPVATFDEDYYWVGVLAFPEDFVEVVVAAKPDADGNLGLRWETRATDGSFAQGRAPMPREGGVSVGAFEIGGLKQVSVTQIAGKVTRAAGTPRANLAENALLDPEECPAPPPGGTDADSGYVVLHRLGYGDHRHLNEALVIGHREPRHANIERAEFIEATLGGTKVVGTICGGEEPVGRAPLAVLVMGAGDGRQPTERSRFNIASELARDGVQSLLVDERGMGKSGGTRGDATLQRCAEDVVAIAELAAKRPDVDAGRISVVGYSDGAVIAAMAAAKSQVFRRAVLLVPPSADPIETLAGPAIDLHREVAPARGDILAAIRGELARRPAALRPDMPVPPGVDDETWAAVKARVGQSLGAMSARDLDLLGMDPADVIARAARPGTEVQVIVGDADRTPMSSDPQRIEDAARGHDGMRVIHEPISHALVDNGPPESSRAYDPLRSVSPELVKRLRALASFAGAAR